jgi:predicted transcriptional regulator
VFCEAFGRSQKWYHTGIKRLMAMTLRLSEEQTAKLRAAAERDGVSMHAAVLKAVDDYLDRRTARRDEMLGRIVKEHDGLLRRLSDA